MPNALSGYWDHGNNCFLFLKRDLGYLLGLVFRVYGNIDTGVLGLAKNIPNNNYVKWV
jgi:hypothetical protein